MTLTIDGVDRSSLVDWASCEIEKNVTSQPDFFRFHIARLSASQTFIPDNGDVVTLVDGSTTLFGGKIIEINKTTVSGLSGMIEVVCKDYTLELERKQVVQDYDDETVEDIVKDIVHRYCSSGVMALSTDGVNDYVSVPHSATLNISGNFSIEYWIKTSSTDGGIVIGKDAYNCYWSYLSDLGYVSIAFYSGSVKELYSVTTVNDGNWHHVVGVYNGSTLKIYIDGVEDNSGSFSGAVATSGNNLYIGARNATPDDEVAMLLDEIRIYSKALSPTEVTTHYANGLGQYGSAESNLVALWHCDEGTGSTINDSSGNSNTGTLNNGATFGWGKVSDNILIDAVDSITDVLDKVRFNYVSVFLAFKEIADLTDCDWWVDYDKVLHFQKRGSTAAPFDLAEDKESFIYDTFSFKSDLSQIRNALYIRGGQERYTTTSGTAEKYIADGQQRIFPLGQKYVKDAIFTVETSPSPYSVWTAKTVGIYGTDDPTAYDVLYDSNNRSLIWPDGSKPAATVAIRVYGNYYLPIIIYKSDIGSITTNGLFEFRIVDSTIKSRDEAKQRATSELLRYANSISSGGFETYQDGLEPGMLLDAVLPTIGIDGSYYIQRVVLTFENPTGTVTKRYRCDIVGSEVVDTIDILIRLLLTDVSKKIEIADDEIVDTIYGITEGISITENGWTSETYPRASPTFTEAISVSNADTVLPFGTNVAPIWIPGDYFPSVVSDQRRVPQLDASLTTQ